MPFGKVEPEGGLHTMVTDGQLVPAEKVTTAEHCPGSVGTTMLVGHVRHGRQLIVASHWEVAVIFEPLSCWAHKNVRFVPRVKLVTATLIVLTKTLLVPLQR